MADGNRWLMNKIEECRLVWLKDDEESLRQNEEKQRQRQKKDEKKMRQFDKRQKKLLESDEEKRRKRRIKQGALKSEGQEGLIGLDSIYCEDPYLPKETEDYDHDVGIASIYCVDPYLTEDVYRVADPSAGQFKYYRNGNTKTPVNIVNYKKENMIRGGYNHKSNTVSETREKFPKNRKNYTRKEDESDKREKEIRFLKNLNDENKKEIERLNDELADDLSLVGRLKTLLFEQERETEVQKETVNELKTELERVDKKHKIEIEELNTAKWDARKKVVEMHRMLDEKDREKSNWVKIIEDKDNKIEEINRDLMIKQENITELNRTLAEKDELVKRLKNDHNENLDLLEKELSSLKKLVSFKDERIKEVEPN